MNMMSTPNETLKSTTLELTINPGYVQNWGLWEALRELIQNAMDAHDQGYAMSIERGQGAAKTIYIRNDGVSITRSALLLGATSKDGGGFRGKFGEGLKLALLVLARSSVEVQVRTGGEIWTPYLERSEAFGGTILKVRVRPASKHVEKVEVQVHGLTDGDWATSQDRLLDVPGLKSTAPKEGEVFRAPTGAKVLFGEKYRSKLFARGIYVGQLPDQYSYGYDLPDVELDRDRKMADTWSLRAHLSAVLGQAMLKGALSGADVLDLLNQDTGEAQAIAARYEYSGISDDLTRAVTKAFEEKHGEDSVPVSGMGESLEAEHNSMKGKMVSKAIKTLVEKEKGSFNDRKKSRDMDARSLYSIGDLSAEERLNLEWAAKVVAFAAPLFDLNQLQVVDFYGENTLGSFQGGLIRVAKKVVGDRRELLSTLIHEVAHNWGRDGSVSHERQIERMFAEVAVRLSNQ